MGGRWSEEVILDHETLWGRIDLGRWTTGGFSWLVTTLEEAEVGGRVSLREVRERRVQMVEEI